MDGSMVLIFYLL